MTRVFSNEEISKLKQLMEDGVQTLQEVEDLNGGLNDTIKAISEELDIKPSVLKKAIKTAQKNDFADKTEEYDILESILISTKKV